MKYFKFALTYFLVVFGAGFVFGVIRVPFLVPRLGERTAELLEMPLMLLVILWVSRWLVRRHPGLPRFARLAAGGLAFFFLIVAELLLVVLASDQSIGQYISSRDPVSGSVYLACLVVFAVAPALWPCTRQ